MSPELARFEIQRFGRGEVAGAWRGALAGFDERSAEVLKREGGSAVYKARLLDRDVVIKIREMRGIKERFKLWMGSTRGLRQWRGAELLMARRLATARPFVLAIERVAGVMREWLVIELLPGKTLLQHIADRDLPVREEHRLARSIARQMAAMSHSGLYNRDHKPSNLVVSNGEAAIIDCVAIRSGGHMFWRMMHALAVEPMGLGILPRRALRARVVNEFLKAEMEADPAFLADPKMRRHQRRAYWSMVTESLQKHGDPIPRTSPLAPPPPTTPR